MSVEYIGVYGLDYVPVIPDFSGHDGPVYDLAFTSDARALISCSKDGTSAVGMSMGAERNLCRSLVPV